MKKFNLICITLIMSCLTLGAQTESIDCLVRKAKRSYDGNGDKIDMNVPGWLVRFGLNFVDEDDLEGVDVKRFARKISDLRIVVIEGRNASLSREDIADFNSGIKREGYEDLMVVRSDGDHVRIMSREDKYHNIRNIVLLVEEKGDNEFVLLSLEGKFTMDDFNAMVENVKIEHNYSQKTKKVKTVNSDN